MRRLSLYFFAATLALQLIPLGLAQQASVTTVPNLIRYGGTLKDAQGVPLASSTVGVTFAIYGQQEGGAAIWMETQNVATDPAGNYGVLLGSDDCYRLARRSVLATGAALARRAGAGRAGAAARDDGQRALRLQGA